MVGRGRYIFAAILVLCWPLSALCQWDPQQGACPPRRSGSVRRNISLDPSGWPCVCRVYVPEGIQNVVVDGKVRPGVAEGVGSGSLVLKDLEHNVSVVITAWHVLREAQGKRVPREIPQR